MRRNTVRVALVFVFFPVLARPSMAKPSDSPSWPIVELRQYTLHPGQRDVLIDLFEAEFIESQEALGMKILGTFRDLDRPDRLVWIRGFQDMASRAAGLEAFYSGPVWKAHRNAANATMLDSGNVLLLHVARPGSGLAPTDRRPPKGASEIPRGSWWRTSTPSRPRSRRSSSTSSTARSSPNCERRVSRCAGRTSPRRARTTFRHCRSARTSMCSSGSPRSGIRPNTSGASPDWPGLPRGGRPPESCRRGSKASRKCFACSRRRARRGPQPTKRKASTAALRARGQFPSPHGHSLPGAPRGPTICPRRLLRRRRAARPRRPTRESSARCGSRAAGPTGSTARVSPRNQGRVRERGGGGSWEG